MLHLTDEAVEETLHGVGLSEIEDVLRDAFVGLAAGNAAQQSRIRTDAGGIKLSTLGAVVPGQGVAGAKVYTTIGGRFSFLIVLFSTATGEPVATLAANAVTRRRTAAVSLLAARAANAPGNRIVVFGTGTQAKAHAEAFGAAFPHARLRMIGRAELAASTQSDGHAQTASGGVREAVAGADIVVTATRSATALFDGGWVAPGAFVAAVGSSRPDTRELDDALLKRSARVIIESRAQTLAEAGDLLLAGPAVRSSLTIVELGSVLAGTESARNAPDEIVIFKSVGVGIEDVAVAGLVYRKFTGRQPQQDFNLRGSRTR
jgi:ornithine cyclodeaminase